MCLIVTVRCPRCRSLQRIGRKFDVDGPVQFSRYSDGARVGHPEGAFIDEPIVFHCTRCRSLCRVDDAQEEERRRPWPSQLWDIVLPWAKMATQCRDACDEALRGDLLHDGERRNVLEAFLHRSNDPYRLLPDAKKIAPEERGDSWRDHLTSLLGLYDRSSARDVAYQIEICRELGQFDEAQFTFDHHWTFGPSDTEWYGIESIKKLILSENPFVQRVFEFPHYYMESHQF